MYLVIAKAGFNLFDCVLFLFVIFMLFLVEDKIIL